MILQKNRNFWMSQVARTQKMKVKNSKGCNEEKAMLTVMMREGKLIGGLYT